MSWEMTLAIMLAITGSSALFVAWPLLAGRTREEDFLGEEPTEPVLQRLLFRHDTLRATMKELEFDLAMGNLSRGDFDLLQERYRAKSLSLLSRIDMAKAGKLTPRMLRELDEEQDEEPAAISTSAAKPGRIDLDVEQEIEEFRRKSRSTPVCPECGHRNKELEAAFCSKCGSPMRPSSPQRRKKPSNPRGGRE